MMPITHLFSRFYSIFQTARLKLEANLLRPHQKLITSDIIPYKYSYSFEKQFDENHQDNLGNLSVNGYIELLYHAMLGSNYSDNLQQPHTRINRAVSFHQTATFPTQSTRTF